VIYLGKAFIKVNGALLESMPGAKLVLGGFKRTPVVGANKVLGFSEEPVPGTVECELAVSKESKPEEWAAWSDVSVTFECDTGQVYIVRGAFLEEPPELTAEEGGKVPVKLTGQRAERVN
jgi:hypothetical protein